MSGIVGISAQNSTIDLNLILKMSDSIAHRGQNSEKVIGISTISNQIIELVDSQAFPNYLSGQDFRTEIDTYFAHRMLSATGKALLDHQPMINKDRSIVLVFDGEIYNYSSLKNELSEYEFRWNTDSEVLLHAYEKWGFNCLNKLNGIWAFVVYDSKRRILFGARDRFGSKPLYFAQTSAFFAFSSEAKGLLAIPGFSRKLNHNCVNAYLRTSQDFFESETFFNDITELIPSYYFVYNLDTKRLTTERYYDLPFNDIWEQFNEEKSRDYIEEVRHKIFQAINLRLNDAASFGSCLSGGIDSSAIACSIDKLVKSNTNSTGNTNLAVVTACYVDSYADESHWAKYVVDQVSADWYKIFPEKEELINDIEDLIVAQDFPFCSTSIYAQYRVMKAAKEAGISVLFDGQGGDELFSGYTPYYIGYYSEAKKNRDYITLKNEQKYIRNTPFGNRNIEEMLIKNNVKTVLQKLLPIGILEIIRAAPSQPEVNYLTIKGKTYKQYNYTTLNQMLYIMMASKSLPPLLRYADRNAMRFSIKARMPFADDINLIEYVFNIPGVYKIHNGWSKYLLRESMENIIPEKIKTRTDKIGFATPEYEWLKTIKPLVFDSICPEINEIINIPRMKSDWEKIIANQNKKGVTNIWKFINLILWFKLFKVTL